MSMKSKIGDRIMLDAKPRRRRPAGEGTSQRRLSAARLLAKLAEGREWAPDHIRATRLAALRHAVESGSYRIDHERTARAILGEMIGEALA